MSSAELVLDRPPHAQLTYSPGDRSPAAVAERQQALHHAQIALGAQAAMRNTIRAREVVARDFLAAGYGRPDPAAELDVEPWPDDPWLAEQRQRELTEYAERIAAAVGAVGPALVEFAAKVRQSMEAIARALDLPACMMGGDCCHEHESIIEQRRRLDRERSRAVVAEHRRSHRRTNRWGPPPGRA